MRLSIPRVPPLADHELSADAAELLKPMRGGNRVFNIFRTLAHYPELFKRWLVFANHVLYKSALSPRDRELAILRIGFLCRSGYEFNQHVVIGKQVGINDAEIERLKVGPAAPGWSDAECALLTATDELRADAFISDATWGELTKHYETKALMDLVFAVGQYNMVSMVLNTFGVQLDEGLPTHKL